MSDTHTTAHIPDEAVQAGAEAIELACTVSTEEMARVAIAAALPHLSAPCVVTMPVDHSELLGNSEQLKPVDVAAVREAILSINIHDEANSYEWRGEGSDYTPQPHEKALLEDFGHGLISQVEDTIRALSAEPAQGEQWQPSHRHVKRGTEYQLIGTGKMQAEKWYEYPCERPVNSIDMQEVAIYRGDDGQLWVRPVAEFNDGRFEILPAAPTTEAGK